MDMTSNGLFPQSILIMAMVNNLASGGFKLRTSGYEYHISNNVFP